jgi:hypothetical protein
LYCLLWERFALFVGALLFGSCSEVLSEVGQAGGTEFEVIIQRQDAAAAGAASVLFVPVIAFPMPLPDLGGVFTVVLPVRESA